MLYVGWFAPTKRTTGSKSLPARSEVYPNDPSEPDDVHRVLLTGIRSRCFVGPGLGKVFLWHQQNDDLLITVNDNICPVLTMLLGFVALLARHNGVVQPFKAVEDEGAI